MKKLLTIYLLLIISFTLCAQDNKYSLDTKETQTRKYKKKKQTRLTREEKFVIKYETRKAKADKKKKKTDYRQHRKAVKDHNRLINGKDKNIVTGKKVHKQMKRSKREAMRRNKGKNPLPWHKRIF